MGGTYMPRCAVKVNFAFNEDVISDYTRRPAVKPRVILQKCKMRYVYVRSARSSMPNANISLRGKKKETNASCVPRLICDRELTQIGREEYL